jgi:hypothetical protein
MTTRGVCADRRTVFVDSLNSCSQGRVVGRIELDRQNRAASGARSRHEPAVAFDRDGRIAAE